MDSGFRRNDDFRKSSPFSSFRRKPESSTPTDFDVFQQAPGAMVCVVIVHYRAPELLKNCLESFVRHPPTLPYRIVVADNSAQEQSNLECAQDPVRQLVESFPDTTYLAMPDNLGFAGANNSAVQSATEPYLFFLNPDTEITAGTLENLVQRIESDLTIGAVGPLNVGIDGAIQSSFRSFPSYLTLLGNRYSLLTRWFPQNWISTQYLKTDWNPHEAHEVDWVSGAAFLIRRSDYEQLGGFDEHFFLYAEDVDLCFRLHQAGRKIVYEPAAKIVHRMGGSSHHTRFRALWERHRSMYLFYRKHYSLEIPLIDFATLLGISLRGFLFLLLEALGRSPHR
jgi:GT2 family glycosyltransferase